MLILIGGLVVATGVCIEVEEVPKDVVVAALIPLELAESNEVVVVVIPACVELCTATEELGVALTSEVEAIAGLEKVGEAESVEMMEVYGDGKSLFISSTTQPEFPGIDTAVVYESGLEELRGLETSGAIRGCRPVLRKGLQKLRWITDRSGFARRRSPSVHICLNPVL